MPEVAVIGDRFMKPEIFASTLRTIPGADLDIRTQELAWPDEPMSHGYAGTRSRAEGVHGQPEDIVDFLADAEILVTHLAPVNGWLLDRCPERS